MNINRINLREENLENLYLGNKMVKLQYNGEIESYSYYDITIVKELFKKQDENNYLACTDFSNFQSFEKSQPNIPWTEQQFKALKLFSPLEQRTYYAAHLIPLWRFIPINNYTIEEVQQFMQEYNNKLMKKAIKTFEEEQLNIKDWWYISDYYHLSEEDIVEIVSIKEDKIEAGFSALKGPVKFQKRKHFNIKRPKSL